MSRVDSREVIASATRLRRLRLIARLLREEGIVSENFDFVVSLADALLASLAITYP